MLGYNASASRFVDKATGRFVSRSRGLSSSVARQEFSKSASLADIGFEIMPYEDLERAIEPRHAAVSIDIQPGATKDFLDDWTDSFVSEDDLDLDQEDGTDQELWL